MITGKNYVGNHFLQQELKHLKRLTHKQIQKITLQ